MVVSTRRPYARTFVCALLLAGCTGDAARETESAATPAIASTGQLAAPDTTRSGNRRMQSTEASPTRAPCVVDAVSDGDSFRCRDIPRVRLLLLDAPEMDQPPFGARSRDALRARMPRGDTVWLEFDVQREDRYGRTLAHAWTARVGGEHLNLRHARDGWAVAVVFPPNVRYIESIRAAVAEARRNRRGLWQDGTFTCEPIAHKQGKC
jgi:endonuclease YncB( thermonuclease family)